MTPSMVQRLLLSLSVAALCLALVHAEHWAVIVVGSRGYENYRHQADGCHAYHVVRRHGIPAENVILMMYDDVAAHKENPFPGKLFNQPTKDGVNPVDVYEGCKVDYRGKEVTPEAFVQVLTGEQSGVTEGKKVLNSTAEDRVFINFVDHGSRGFIMFPQGDMLTTKNLTQALTKMHAEKKYQELVFYMEACESGSMFSNSTLKKLNAFATTAANSYESSWGTYCPPYDVVNGTSLGTCLGDLYSVNWMQDSDLTDLSAESVSLQFQRIKKLTTKSHTKKFGSAPIQKEIVGNFQSTYDLTGSATGSASAGQETEKAAVLSSDEIASAIDVHDVALVMAFYKYLRAPVGQDRRQLANALVAQIQTREAADDLFSRVQAIYQRQMRTPLTLNRAPSRFDCHDKALKLFESQCSAYTGRRDPDISYGLNSYSIKYAGMVVDLCESALELDAIASILKQACAEPIFDSRFQRLNGLWH